MKLGLLFRLHKCKKKSKKVNIIRENGTILSTKEVLDAEF